MRVTEFLKQNPITSPASIFDDIPDLLSRSMRNGQFPPPLPLPFPQNIVTGSFPDSVNSFRFELEALARGYDRALLITSADAAFLSLRPRDKPVLAAFRSQNSVNIQSFYFLDSFTPDSLSNLYAFANPTENNAVQDVYTAHKRPLPDTILSPRNKIAEKVIYFISSHDTGQDTRDLRLKSANLYRENSSPASPLYSLVSNSYKTCTANIPSRAVKTFDYLRKYRSQQFTGLNILGNGETDDNTRKSFEYLSKSSPQEIIQTIFFASAFTSQLCRGRSDVTRPSASPDRHPGHQTLSDPSGSGKETPIDELLGRN